MHCISSCDCFTGPLHRWQHNCKNLFHIPHLETLISLRIPRCIRVLATIVTATAAVHHGTWSRPAGQTDLCIAWISTEIQYEFNTQSTPSHEESEKAGENDTKLKEMHSTRGCVAFKCVSLVWEMPDQVLLPTIEPGWSGTNVPSGQRVVASSQKCKSSSGTSQKHSKCFSREYKKRQERIRCKLHCQRKTA